MKRSISLCMIVKNEEAVLERCFESIHPFFDELVVVDTGSTDRTVSIARKWTDKVFFFPWCDDFSKARNFAFSKASGTHRMWLDADDVVPKPSLEVLLAWKETPYDEREVLYLPYETAFDESGNAVFSFERERIVPAALSHKWKGRVHETLAHNGTIKRLNAPIRHASVKHGYSDRNVNIYERMIEEQEPFSARDWFYYGRELFYHQRYREAIEVLNWLLSQEDGWSQDRIEAIKVLSYCYGAIKEPLKERDVLLRAFSFGAPRADVCCQLGQWHMKNGNNREAVFWYQTALQCGICREEQGFRDVNAEAFVPYLQLCVLYDRMGKHREAEEWNHLAAKVRPQAKAVLHNQAYFERRKGTAGKQTE